MVADALLELETVSGSEVERLLAGCSIADLRPTDEPEAESPEAESPEAESPEAEIKVEELSALLEDPFLAPSELEAENAELKDQLLRALAETENVRRRAQKEKEDIGRFAISDFARDMLSVADNLHRTIEAIPEAVLSEDHELNGLYRGVELVERDPCLQRRGRRDQIGNRFRLRQIELTVEKGPLRKLPRARHPRAKREYALE